MKNFLLAQSGIDCIGMTLPSIITKIHEDHYYETHYLKKMMVKISKLMSFNPAMFLNL